MIYLDYAAATPLDPLVLRAMQPYFTNQFYNPSEIYLAARSVRRDLEQARAEIAKALGTRPAEIVFTAGATEANNLAIRGVMDKFPDGELLISSIEHESVLEPSKLYKYKLIPVDGQGIVDLDKLAKMINDKTVLVSVMMVNNELGTIQPISKISQLLNKLSNSRKSKRPLYLHSDAAQAGNLFSLNVSRLGVDILSLNGGKIYGPKQSGVLYVKAGTELQPQISGGGQEFGLRSGTENVPSIIGLAKALDLAQAMQIKEQQRISGLRQLFIDQINQAIPQAIINGSNKHQSPHILSVTFPGFDNERLMMELDEEGIIAAVGSACSASEQEASHVLTAIGLDESAAHSTLRFSFGRQTTASDIRQTIKTLKRLTAFNR